MAGSLNGWPFLAPVSVNSVNGGWDGAVITPLASTTMMRHIRQLLAQRHLHPQINFAYRFRRHHHFRIAFVTPPLSAHTPTIAMAASVLVASAGLSVD